MTAAKKALDALSVPPDQRWTPATWANDDGEWVARGPKRVNRNPVPIPGESEDDYADRCLDADISEPGCDGDRQAQADAARMCLAVNLASPLAAVARAAMEYHKARADEEALLSAEVDALGDAYDRTERACNRLDAALYALEKAAAKEVQS